MEIQDVISGSSEIAMVFYNSSFFSVIKVLLSVYVMVLFADLILVLMLRGVGANVRASLKGMDMPAGTKGKMTKRWLKIVQRLETGNTSQYKVAILEADKFVDEILGGIGYKGKNMAEKINQVKIGQLDNIDELLRAHKIRNEIVNRNNFSIDENSTKEVIGIYESFLKSLEFIND